MAAVVYPGTLPCPAVATLTPADRVRRSSLPGLMQLSGKERDFRAMQEVTFTFSEEQAATFNVWWRDTLFRGGLWFTATGWPLPAGWNIEAVRRFSSTPQWSAIGAGFWAVSASLEVRGRSLPPQYVIDPIVWDAAVSDEHWIISDMSLLATMFDPNPDNISRNVLSNRQVTSGRFYFEISVVDASTSSNATGHIGLTGPVHQWAALYDGSILVDGVPTEIYEPPTYTGKPRWDDPTTLMFLADTDLGLLFFGKGGDWLGADPDTNTAPGITDFVGPVTVFAAHYASFPEISLRLRATSSDLLYAIPNGAIPIGDAV